MHHPAHLRRCKSIYIDNTQLMSNHCQWDQWDRWERQEYQRNQYKSISNRWVTRQIFSSCSYSLRSDMVQRTFDWAWILKRLHRGELHTVAHQGQGLFSLSGSEIFINHDVELGSWYSVTRECYRYIVLRDPVFKNWHILLHNSTTTFSKNLFHSA
jgi:hypothetical protein